MVRTVGTVSAYKRNPHADRQKNKPAQSAGVRRRAPVYWNANSPYETCDTVETTHDLVLFGHYTGLSWKTRTYTEVTLSYEPLTPQQVLELAGPQLEAELVEQAGEGAVVAARDIRYKSVDETNILVTLTMEFTEQIGVQKQIDTILETQPPVQENKPE